MSFLTRALLASVIALVPVGSMEAQENRPRVLSPRDSAVQAIGQAQVVVDYGRPSKRGREIYGALVPYERVWRTGANKATHLRTDRDIMIGELRVPQGSYTLYTIPAQSGWTLIINRQTNQWGTEYDASQDLGRVPMAVAALKAPVEQFTIAVEPTGSDAGVLRMSWDSTEASVPIRVAK
jgi:hypothetical protein